MKSLGKPTFAYTLLYHYTRFLYKHAYCRTYTVIGEDNVPLSGPVLFITSHQNNLPDPLSLLFSTHRKPTFVARADYFNHPLAARLLQFLKILPMHRADHGRSAIRNELPTTMHTLRDYLAEGHSCAIMIEGSSAPTRTLRPLKKGWARLVLDLKEIDILPTVIPVAIEFSDWQDWGPDNRIVFGKPLKLEIEELTRAQELRHLNDLAKQSLSYLISNDEDIEAWHNATTKRRRSVNLLWKGFGLPFLAAISVYNLPVFALSAYRVHVHSRQDFKSTLQIGFIGLGSIAWFLLTHIIAIFFVNPLIVAFSVLTTPLLYFIAARTYIAWKRG